MPQEAYEELTQVERIKAHLEHNYTISEEDGEYLAQLMEIFRIVQGDEYAQARQKISQLYRHKFDRKRVERLIKDCTAVFGDFFEINQLAMRIIQLKRHERLYEAALRGKDFVAAGRELAAIDKLSDLYGPGTKKAAIGKLPRIRRTSDPSALRNLHDHGQEEE